MVRWVDFADLFTVYYYVYRFSRLVFQLVLLIVEHASHTSRHSKGPGKMFCSQVPGKLGQNEETIIRFDTLGGKYLSPGRSRDMKY